MIQSVKKTALTIFLLMLFMVISIVIGIVFLAVLQWVMHTDFYFNLVGSVLFWKWGIGVSLLILFLNYCMHLSS